MHVDQFALTYDYRCPFARIAALHVVEARAAGMEVAVTWSPFSLTQAHRSDQQAPVWEDPSGDTGLLALQVAAATASVAPDRFDAVHLGLYDLRHVHHRSLTDPDALNEVLRAHDVDADAIWDLVGEGGPLDAVRKAHEWAVTELDVWGVPTFIVGEQAAFVRLMAPPVDGEDAQRTVCRVLGMLGAWPELNEFKHTRLSA